MITTRHVLPALATALLSAGLVGGIGPAAAQPDDLTMLLIDPNTVADTLAYTPGQTTMNPGGQPGASRVYLHRDGRTITDTVWVLADPAAAAAALDQARTTVSITNPTSEPVAVGSDGQFVSGTSPDGTQSVSLLSFSSGNAASTIEFAGPLDDAIPAPMAVEFGQAQESLIKTQLGG